VLAALRAYRNPDGGFGNALEPDLRGPHSEVAATLHALEVLDSVDALDDPLVPAAADWIDGIAGPDGGVPFALPATADVPHAPWMQPDLHASPFTFALAAQLLRAGLEHSWLRTATATCWAQVESGEPLEGYSLKCALEFLDAVPDAARRDAVLPRLAAALRPDGSVPVPGGTADEKLTALVLSPRPDAPSRRLFTAEQIAADLDALERGQQDDGGWTFDWLAWSPAQALEWRGIVTVRALAALSAHGRVPPPRLAGDAPAPVD
jgi:hypothetical protein